ncbi:transcriptional repressor CTCF [Culex quinquefasciatus]|uniref:transcriptional repressor CTCF n=1 Tax=Culex quinquefasciatus TaxID=7176 RepID=UPI0018E2B812|nr:transcriptional repressor CTCF [Culex quinquefasciatus]
MSSEASEHQNNAVAVIPPTAAVVEPGKMFQCVHCPKLFRSTAALQRHTNSHHPAFERCPMQCRLCPYLTSKRLEFFRHHRESHPGITCCYCCPLCHKIYRALGQFYDHCLVHMALNEYEGGAGEDQDMASVENLEVGLGEDSLDDLRDAGPTDSDLPDLTVDFAVAEISTSFTNTPPVNGKSSNSIEHSTAVKRPRSSKCLMPSTAPPSKAQTHRCPYCPEQSQVPNWLQVHAYMCHGALVPTALQFMCVHCDSIETDSVKFEAHYRDQHAELPLTYKCPTCGKLYRRLFFYEAHFKSHAIPQLLEKHGLPKGNEHSFTSSESQSFACPECSATCADLTAYETHLQEKHAELGLGSNHDPGCSALSANSINDDAHQEVLQCLLCQRNFTDATRLVRHQEACLLGRGMPTAETETAPETEDVVLVKEEIDCYLTGASWYKEVVIPQSKVYSCAECDKRFDSLALVERHTIAEHCPENLSLLYKCNKCAETFGGFAMFQRHSLKHI